MLHWISDTGLSVLPVDCAKPAWKSVDCHKGQRKPGKIFRIQSAIYKTFVYCISAGLAGLAELIRSSGGNYFTAEMGIVPSVKWLYGLQSEEEHFSRICHRGYTGKLLKSMVSESFPAVWSYL